MALRDRRNFLKSGGVVLGAITAEACAISGSASTTPRASVAPSSGSQVASFGWEVCNLHGNGANAYFSVMTSMVLQTVSVDVSASIVKPSIVEGFAEVLCVGGVSRQSSPAFNNVPPAYVNFPASSNFGNVSTDNPNGLSVIMDGNMLQDQFLAVILKTWVPTDGAGSATARHVVVSPSLTLDPGDNLVFHMDHVGISLDCEMQVVLTYSLSS